MTLYHVTLNGQGYVLDLDRYVKRIREPFAAKQGSGSVALADLRGPEQVLAISDWSGGDGAVQHEDAGAGQYRSGASLDGHSVPGSLRLCVRVLVLWNTDKPQKEITHVYIKEAQRLRPDLSKLPPVDWAELESWIEEHITAAGNK